jgi:hypothetical protein
MWKWYFIVSMKHVLEFHSVAAYGINYLQIVFIYVPHALTMVE